VSPSIAIGGQFDDPGSPFMATPRSNTQRPARALATITRHATATLALMVLTSGAGAFADPAPTAPAAGKPWTYQSTNHDYRLTLPTDRWRQPDGKPPGSDAFFVYPTVAMHASVMLVKRKQTADDLAKAAAHGREFLESSPARKATATFDHGTNAAGNQYHYFTAVEPSGPGQQVFIGNSFTWNPHTGVLVVVLFEGVQKAKSQADKAAELVMFTDASHAICLSVE
jgi:hypothetical protein